MSRFAPNEELIEETKNGCIVENKKEEYFRILIYDVANYDGIIDKHVSITKITYSGGLIQSWEARGYFANYYKCYKGRENALAYAKKQIA